jgi:hypothetical protein
MYGPFQIDRILSNSTFSLILPNYVLIHNVFALDQLEFFAQKADVAEPPVVVFPEWGADFEFTIERILEHQWVDRNIQFLIHWTGYTTADQTWEPLHNLVETLDGVYVENEILSSYCTENDLNLGDLLLKGGTVTDL